MRFATLCLLFFCWVSFASVSEAQKKKLTAAEQQFNTLVTQATESFKLQDFKKALAGYKDAYKIDPVPALLLAMGQCYRALEQYDPAIRSYKQYLLESPEATDKKAVEETIKELERLVAQGTLDFSTDPSEVQLYIDGELKGTTPITITGIEPGEHKIKLVKDGYAMVEKTFNFAPGQRQSIGTSLEPMPGFLEVASEQDPITVFVNGAFAGATPFKLEMRAGEYLLQYKKEKFQSQQEKKVILPGQVTKLAPNLEPGKGNIEIQTNLKGADITIGKIQKKTDTTGKAVFTEMPAGTHKIQISKPPFQDSTQTIELAAEDTEKINTFIKPPPLPKLLYGASGASLLGTGIFVAITIASTEVNDGGRPVGLIPAVAFAGTWAVSGTLATVLYVKQRVDKIAENREMKKDTKKKSSTTE